MNLPLTNNPSFIFSFNINGIVYKFKQTWNTSGFWVLDILDINDNAFIFGIKLVTQEDLLHMHPTIPFGLYSNNPHDPTRDNLDKFKLSIIGSHYE